MICEKSDLSWGCELEFGDIPRWVEIPAHLGSWEYFETDIVNQRDPYWGIAADPYGKDPPYGGEINTVPTKTWIEQVGIINQLITYFRNLGYEPTVSCVQQLHIHVGFSERLIKNRPSMVNLIHYIKNNQKTFIEKTSQFVYDDRMNEQGVEFLRDDGGRLAPDSMYDDMIQVLGRYRGYYLKFLNLDQTAYEGLYLRRFGINLKSLQYGTTIEFRSFRSTTNIREIFDSFRICENFILLATNGIRQPFVEHFDQNNYQLPKFVYDHDLFTSWQKTKKERRADVKTRPFVSFNEI